MGLGAAASLGWYNVLAWAVDVPGRLMIVRVMAMLVVIVRMMVMLVVMVMVIKKGRMVEGVCSG